MTKNYELEGMNCSGGLNNVKWALLKIPEVQAADVQLNPQRATVTMSRAFDVAELQAHISKSGNYTITEI